MMKEILLNILLPKKQNNGLTDGKILENITSILQWNGSKKGLSKSWDVKGDYKSFIYKRDRAIYFNGDFNGDRKIDLLGLYQYPSKNIKYFN